MSDIKELIRKEIERRIKPCRTKNGFPAGTISAIKIETYEGLLAFIDSLPEEKSSNDLEKTAGRLGFDYVDNIVHESPEHRWNDHDVEFGYRDGFIAGAEWKKNQMLKDAVEADVNTYEDLAAGKSWAEFVVEMPTNKLDDKVRIIIVKED